MHSGQTRSTPPRRHLPRGGGRVQARLGGVGCDRRVAGPSLWRPRRRRRRDRRNRVATHGGCVAHGAKIPGAGWPASSPSVRRSRRPGRAGTAFVVVNGWRRTGAGRPGGDACRWSRRARSRMLRPRQRPRCRPSPSRSPRLPRCAERRSLSRSSVCERRDARPTHPSQESSRCPSWRSRSATGCRLPLGQAKRAGGLPLATRGARVERVGLYSCSCDAVIDDFGCGSGSQGLRPWWLHRDDRLGWRWAS